ncbi:MAG: beta-ketoacyl-ACP synthase III [Deferrisomatales bacterium]|nr:beta-ketoacyl-ACP synthase III [Deferrisomatales bacterium]
MQRRHRIAARILGTGRCVPDVVVTNQELAARMDTSDEWIRERTGIRERRIAPAGVRTSELCEVAARQALEAAGIDPEELDLVIVGTATPDMPFPSTACFLQDRLGIRGQMAFDLTAACTGFLYGLSVAEQFVASGASRRALVVGAELLSRIVDWTDRGTCVLFGDGAGAAVLGPSDDPDRGILAARMAADGSHWGILNMPGGGTANPATAESVAAGLHFVKMQGNEVFKVAVRTLQEMAELVLQDAGVSGHDVDLFLPHQANRRIIDAVAKRLRVPDDKVYVNVDRYGNTSAASIPIALDEVVRSGRVRPGDLLLLDAFGGGVTYGAVLLRW